MNLFLLPLLITFLTVGLVAARAALPPQLYWRPLLPTTPPGGIPGGKGGGVSFNTPLSSDSQRRFFYRRWDASDGETNSGGVSINPPLSSDSQRRFFYRRWDASDGDTNSGGDSINPPLSSDSQRRFFYRRWDASDGDTNSGGDSINPPLSSDSQRRFFYRRWDASDGDTNSGGDSINPPLSSDSQRRFFYRRWDASDGDTNSGGDSINPPLSSDSQRRFFYRRWDASDGDTNSGGDSINPPLSSDSQRRFFYRRWDASDGDTNSGGDSINPPLSSDSQRRFIYRRWDASNGDPNSGGVSTHPPVIDDARKTHFRCKYNASDGETDGGSGFLSEESLKAGYKLKVDLTDSSDGQRPFLPPRLAASIPFSTSKLDDILKRFNLKPGSPDSQIMKQTLMDCEDEPIQGETKYCATSLESMVDFAMSKLEGAVEALSTEPVKETTGKQEYTIIAPGATTVAENMVGCHRAEYPYAVFYCHKMETAVRVYMVPLEGKDGTRVNTIVVCHTDTSQWSPKHMAFKVLKGKPGTISVCHFIPPQDHLVWVSKRLQML